MLYTLIVAAALGAANLSSAPNNGATQAAQKAQPLFPRVFPAPTGQNALEFYVRANDLVTAYGQVLVTPSEVQGTGQTLLSIQVKRSSRTGEILSLVKRGNQFAATMPTTPAAQNVLPAIKNVSKALSQLARVQFANGLSNQATDTLLTILEMSDTLRGCTAILGLYVARASDSIALAVFHDNYMAISLPAAEQIIARIKIPDASVLERQWDTDSAEIERVMGEPKEVAIDKLSAYTSSDDLQGADFAMLRRQWQGVMQLGSAGLASLFSQPESTWTKAKGRLSPDKLTSDPVLSNILTTYGPERRIEIAIIWREQRRLLRVHALIAKARWETGSLPETLADLPQEARTDPLTDGAYAYRRLTSAAYDLFSPGNRWFGDIRLKMSTAGMLRIIDGG